MSSNNNISSVGKSAVVVTTTAVAVADDSDVVASNAIVSSSSSSMPLSGQSQSFFDDNELLLAFASLDNDSTYYNKSSRVRNLKIIRNESGYGFTLSRYIINPSKQMASVVVDDSSLSSLISVPEAQANTINDDQQQQQQQEKVR